MAERPILRVENSGPRPLVTKAAHDDPATRRLRHELDVLRRAQHPGVVALVDAAGDDDSDATTIVVRTRHCGSRTLATVGDLTVDRAAGLLAALATTVADLHELGVAHRRLTPDHVLLAGDGRPVLCGFGEATLDASDEDQAADVAALGELLRDLIVDSDDAVPVPTHALGGRRSWTGYQRRALLNLADLATADEPARRPSAHQFAQQLRSAMPGASFEEDSGRSDRAEPDENRRARIRLALVGCLAAVAVTVVGIGFARALPLSGSDTTPGPSAPQPTEPETEPDSEPPPLQRLSPAPSPASEPAIDDPDGLADTEDPSHPWDEVSGCATSLGGPSTRRDGSACDGLFSLESGNLSVGTEVFELDLVDAVAAVGRFSCDRPTAAVLDLTSGGVFVFEAWASPDAPVSATQADVVPGARRLLVEPTDGERCDRLVALDEFGIRHTITSSPRGAP